MLVPKRGTQAPAKGIAKVGNLPINTIWIRERHECLVATTRHLPLLFSHRDSIPDLQDNFEYVPIHRSLPPSPATMKDFIQRGNLMERLWEWLVLSDRPRLYLHGPGGSGKSTLAFEFAKNLSEFGQNIFVSNNERFDYVIFISGKETELNVHSLKQQIFLMRHFNDANEQSIQIAYHSGLIDSEEASMLSDVEIAKRLDELFSSYNGLIVIDDIDTLSRRRLDTGGRKSSLKSC